MKFATLFNGQKIFIVAQREGEGEGHLGIYDFMKKCLLTTFETRPVSSIVTRSNLVLCFSEKFVISFDLDPENPDNSDN